MGIEEHTSIIEEAATALGVGEPAPAADPPPKTAEPPSDVKAAPETPAPATEANLVDKIKGALATGELKAEDLGFLDRHFQSTADRRVSRLEKPIGAVEEAAKARGIELPEGKTIMDLLTENDGKGFTELMAKIAAAGNAPIMERINKAERDEKLRIGMATAQNAFPEVKEHFPEILRRIDSNEVLTEAALVQDGKYVPILMQGVAYAIENQNLKAHLAKAAEIIRKANIAGKVGESTTKSKNTGQPPKEADAPKGSLREIAEAAALRMPEFGGRAN